MDTRILSWNERLGQAEATSSGLDIAVGTVVPVCGGCLGSEMSVIGTRPGIDSPEAPWIGMGSEI